MKVFRNIVIMFILGIVLGFASKAFGQVTPTTWGVFGSVPTYISTNTYSNINSAAITLRQNSGLAVMAVMTQTNVENALVTFVFQVSIDNTNWSSYSGLTMAVPLGGTSHLPTRAYTNFPASLLNNAAYFRLGSITNAHTNNLVLSNVFWSHLN